MSFKNSKRYGGKIQTYQMVNGDLTFYAVIKFGGVKTRYKVGRRSEGITEIKAFSMRNEILSKLRYGKDISQKGVINLDFLATKYFDYSKIHSRSTPKMEELYKNHIKTSFMKPIESISDDDVLSLQRELLDKKYSPGTCNMIVSLLRRIINFGIENEYIKHSPFKHIKMLKNTNNRTRYLTNAEIDELMSNIDNEETRMFVMLALTTGARAEAILSVKKSDIDIDASTILLRDDKSATKYYGFLNTEIKSIINQKFARLSDDDFIVGASRKKVKYGKIYYHITKAFRDLNKQKTKNNKAVVHTLRHTFASHLAINGASISTIQKLLNHKDIKQTIRYAKLSPDSGRVDVERLYR